MMSVLNKQFRVARAAHMTLFGNLLIFRDDIFLQSIYYVGLLIVLSLFYK